MATNKFNRSPAKRVIMRLNPAAVLPGVLGVLLVASGVSYAQLPKPPLRPSMTRLPSVTPGPTTFKNSDSIRDWFPIGNAGSLERKPSGGRPGGYLHVTGLVGRGWAGARTRRAEFIGKYSRPGTISLDLKLTVQQITDYKVRLMLENCPAGLGSNWIFNLNVPGNQTWRHLTVPFDPSWTDAQAIAAGWQRQTFLPPKTWADTLRNVLWVRVFVERPGFTNTPSSSYSCTMGIDNFWVQR